MPAMYVAIQAVASLYSFGQTTGIVLDTGYAVSHAVPIQDGQAMDDSIEQIGFAGRDLTDYLMKILKEKDKTFSSMSELKVIPGKKMTIGN